MITIEQVTHKLEEHADDNYAPKMEAYLKNKFAMYGIRSPMRRTLTKDFIKQSKSLTISQIVDLIDDLWDYDERDYQLIGLDVLIANKKKFTPVELPAIEEWIITKSWWDTIDMIVPHGVGQIGNQKISDLEPFLERWIQDDNIWLNRSCLIFQLKYGSAVDLKRLFRYILIVNHKREFFVQKAIGWSLRQASKFYPQRVAEFIDMQQLSNLAVREGTKYLP